MDEELRIISDSDDGEVVINRHKWVSFALQTPALQRWDDSPWYVRQPDEPTDGPVFRLRGSRDERPAPRLFWMDGQVVVRHIEDGWLPDLLSIATQLKGHLVSPDGGAA